MRVLVRCAVFVLCLAGALPALAAPSVPSQADWDAARQKVTTADGLTLAYVELGKGDGVPLILLHGYTDNSRSWSLVAPYLGDRRILALDLRGHGASDAPACCYGIDTLAHDLGAFMDAMGIEKADLVGHSLGSITVGVFAALHPERVNKLVLVSSALVAPAGARDWLWENVPKLQHPIDPMSQFMLDWYYNPNPVDEDFITRERAESAARPQQVWLGVLEGLTLLDWTPLAQRISVPTLILWGDQDGFFGAAEQDALKQAIPAARFEAFAGYGHNMFWEVPERAGEVIAAFLAD